MQWWEEKYNCVKLLYEYPVAKKRRVKANLSWTDLTFFKTVSFFNFFYQFPLTNTYLKSETCDLNFISFGYLLNFWHFLHFFVEICLPLSKKSGNSTHLFHSLFGFSKLNVHSQWSVWCSIRCSVRRSALDEASDEWRNDNSNILCKDENEKWY